MEHDQRGSNGRQFTGTINRSIPRKAQAEEIQDNIDQVRDNQRQAGSIRDKSSRHDKGQRRRLLNPRAQYAPPASVSALHRQQTAQQQQRQAVLSR